MFFADEIFQKHRLELAIDFEIKVSDPENSQEIDMCVASA